MVAGAGWAAPGGRQSGQTAPPAGTENARCRPGVPQTAQAASAGAQPARAIARSRYASSTSVRGVLARGDSARSAPRVSWNSRSDGSRSTGVSRSAVSAIALAAV